MGGEKEGREQRKKTVTKKEPEKKKKKKKKPTSIMGEKQRPLLREKQSAGSQVPFREGKGRTRPKRRRQASK